jgi:hypothetical protein
VTLNSCSKRNFNEFQTALTDMNMQNQFNKMSVFECQTISESIHKLKQEEFKDFRVLLYKFQDIQGLEFLFSNLRTFKFSTNPVTTRTVNDSSQLRYNLFRINSSKMLSTGTSSIVTGLIFKSFFI